MIKTALITGITGQDGTYLAELLVKKGYRVVGLTRQLSLINSSRQASSPIEYIFGDFTDIDSIDHVIAQVLPDEVYNLASQSYPAESWKRTRDTALVNTVGVNSLFDSVRKHCSHAKIFQASSSEMYGRSLENPQNENTLFNPLNPYAVSKLYAHHLARIYREAYGMFISCGILFNHESPRRGLHFVTQKVCYAAACLKLGIMDSFERDEKNHPIVREGKLYLANLDSKRDWGYAGDYVEAIWLMLQHHAPEDFVIGTGELKSVKQLCETAFSCVGLNWEEYVHLDNKLARLLDTSPVVADIAKVRKVLNWHPKKKFAEMIEEMVNEHMKTIPTLHVQRMHKI